MLIPSASIVSIDLLSSLSRRVNANSQRVERFKALCNKLIKKGEC